MTSVERSLESKLQSASAPSGSGRLRLPRVRVQRQEQEREIHGAQRGTLLTQVPTQAPTASIAAEARKGAAQLILALMRPPE
jgi:hypothetical protein